MARSTKIYIIKDIEGLGFASIRAAFTVKHECQTWIEKNLLGFEIEDEYPQDIWVLSLTDKPVYENKRKEYTLEEFMES